MLPHYGTILCLEKAPLGRLMRRCFTTPSPPSGWGILELGVALILMDGRFDVNNWQISGDACS